MTLLRDVELRWPDYAPAPEWFWKRGGVVYLYRKALRALKIDIGDLAKINVYCGSRAHSYSGEVFDGVTDVHVAADWSGIEHMPTDEICDLFIQLLSSGVGTVLGRFKVSADRWAFIAEEVRAQAQSFSIALGKSAAYRSDKGFSARLYVRPGRNFENCSVWAVVSARRTEIAEIQVFTTFPLPEYAIEGFESLSWSNATQLAAQFEVYASGDRQVFGRRQFDSSGFPHVRHEHSQESHRSVFVVGPPITNVVSAQPTAKSHVRRGNQDIAVQGT